MAKEFEIDAYRKSRELFIILRGRLVMCYCQETKVRLGNLITPTIDQIYLDLIELSFLDSAGLGVLVGLKMMANKNRTQLTMLAPPPRIEDIFRVSKLDAIFDILNGADSDVIRATLKQDDYCLWRDSKDARQIEYNTEANQGSPAHSNLTQVPMMGNEEDEASHRIRQLCLDAVEYLRQGDYQKAIDAYVRALDFEPDNLSALNNLGIVYEKRAEWYALAMDVWKKVMDLSASRGDEKHAARARKHLDSLSKVTKVY